MLKNNLVWVGVGLSEMQQSFLEDNNGRIMPSALSSQNHLYHALSQHFSSAISMNAHRVPEYPKFKKVIIKGDLWNDGRSRNYSISYLNLPLLGRISKIISFILLYETKLSKNLRKDENTFVFYSMNSVFLIFALYLKLKFRNSKFVLVIPDHPMHMRDMDSRWILYLKNIDFKLIKIILPIFDKYICYTEKMGTSLDLCPEKVETYNGSISRNLISKISSRQKYEVGSKVIFLYSGSISKLYLLHHLVLAFQLCQSSHELWITGGGTDEHYIAKLADEASNIKYFGFVSFEELLELQAHASVFVNLRNPDDLHSSYSFPSKLFEFLSAGKPIISARMESIPAVYSPYIHYLDDVSVKAMVDCISEFDPATMGSRFLNSRRSIDFVSKVLSTEVVVPSLYKRVFANDKV